MEWLPASTCVLETLGYTDLNDQCTPYDPKDAHHLLCRCAARSTRGPDLAFQMCGLWTIGQSPTRLWHTGTQREAPGAQAPRAAGAPRGGAGAATSSITNQPSSPDKLALLMLQARGAKHPACRRLARLALAGLPRGGGDGDAIRLGILNIMRDNGIREGHRPVRAVVFYIPSCKSGSGAFPVVGRRNELRPMRMQLCFVTLAKHKPACHCAVKVHPMCADLFIDLCRASRTHSSSSGTRSW